MFDGLFVAVVVASGGWVYLDATSHGIGRIEGESGLRNNSAGVWAIATLLLWIIVFPLYVINRGSLIEKAREHPVEVSGRRVKAGALGILGGLAAVWLGDASVDLPACDGADTQSAIAQFLQQAGLELRGLSEVVETAFDEAGPVRSCMAVIAYDAGSERMSYRIGWHDRESGQFYVKFAQP